MPTRFISLLVLLLTAGLIATGCGGPLSKKEYQREVNKIGTRAEKQLDKVIGGEKTPSESDLNEAKTVFEGAADDLEGLEPPKEIEKTHDLLVKGLRELSKTFGDLGEQVGEAKNDKDRLAVFMKAASDKDAKQAFDDLTKAQKQFEAKGYRIFDDEKGDAAPADSAPAAPKG